MQPKIITIGRQYGSGGREIGEKLAERLGIPCHDKSIIQSLMKEKGYCEEVIERFDEKNSRSLLFSLVMNSYGNWYANDNYQPLQASILKAQAEVIRELAKTPCVIIGRAADSILENEDCINFFIHCDKARRIARIMQRCNCDGSEAAAASTSVDRERARFYNHYTNRKWGDAANYHMTVDSGKLGIDKTADLLCAYLELK